jgi:intracellular sulfur oxidation DsrE/DsrF family protein
MRHTASLILAIGWLLAVSPIAARGATDNTALRVDVPVTLKEAKVVFNLDHPAFEGDEPTGLAFLHILTERFHTDGTKTQLVAVFHGDVGYMLLDDSAYERVRNWQQGNPYKQQIAALMQAGVAIEECGETMLRNHWSNGDLLAGVKVTTSANLRIVELVQQGFVQMQP